MKYFFLSIFLLALLLSPSLASADSGGEFEIGGTGVQLEDPLEGETLSSVLTNIVVFLQSLASIVFTIMILVGAFQMITSGGSPDKFSTGKKTLIYGAFGFAILLAAIGIADIVKDIISTGT